MFTGCALLGLTQATLCLGWPLGSDVVPQSAARARWSALVGNTQATFCFGWTHANEVVEVEPRWAVGLPWASTHALGWAVTTPLSMGPLWAVVLP